MKHTGYNSDAYMYAKDGSLLRIRPVPPLFITSYDYKYNGKELQEELGLNTYAYGWREYDPAIGRFNRMDRFSEKYHDKTAYGYAGNNPILYNDIRGDSIGIGKDIYNKIIENINGRKNKILNSRNKEIEKLNKKGKTDEAKALIAQFSNEDAANDSDMSILNATLLELNELNNSSQVYNFIQDSNLVPEGADGVTSYDVKTDEVNIVSGVGFNMGVFTHEAKHAFQFQTGNLSLGSKGNGGVLYDLNDEYEAFDRGKFFGGLSLSRKEINTLYPGRPQGPYGLTTPSGITTMGEQLKATTHNNFKNGKVQTDFYIGWKSHR